MSEKMTHTPEPWAMDKAKWGAGQWGALECAERGEPNLVGGSLPVIMYIACPENDDHDWTIRPRREDQQDRVLDRHEKLSNADRIVACVNALAGIASPSEFVAGAREQAEELARVTAERVADGAALIKQIQIRDKELAAAIAERDAIIRTLLREVTQTRALLPASGDGRSVFMWDFPAQVFHHPSIDRMLRARAATDALGDLRKQ